VTKEGADWLDPRRRNVLPERLSTNPDDWYSAVRSRGADEFNPLLVIHRENMQGIICRGCLAAWWPDALLPMFLFILAGKDFVRSHRFCVPHDHLLDLPLLRVERQIREPGQDG
jgi:hypothetical protein